MEQDKIHWNNPHGDVITLPCRMKQGVKQRVKQLLGGKHTPIIYHVKTSTPLAVYPDYIPIFVGLFRYLLVNNGWYMVISCYIPYYAGPLGSRCHDLGWRTSIGGKARHLPRFVTAGRSWWKLGRTRIWPTELIENSEGNWKYIGISETFPWR